jgi:hypothetical protein
VRHLVLALEEPLDSDGLASVEHAHRSNADNPTSTSATCKFERGETSEGVPDDVGLAYSSLIQHLFQA